VGLRVLLGWCWLVLLLLCDDIDGDVMVDLGIFF
jgi:hypothetical protein